MSLAVALQSVLYYVLACSACRNSAYRRKRKREAALAKRRKDDLETQHPGGYRHPSPFSTNIYWHEEMALGPGPPQKRSGKEARESQRRLTTSGTGSSVASASSHGDAVRGHRGPRSPRSESTSAGRDWYDRRHQREDEELWGYHHCSVAPGSSQGGECCCDDPIRTSPADIARPPSSPRRPYHVVRNPPLSELHPPVVNSHSTDKTAIRWMLQPPPTARLMSGHHMTTSRSRSGSSRSRSDSGSSSRTTGDVSLGRQLGLKLVEGKMRRMKRSLDDDGPATERSGGDDAGGAGVAHDRINPEGSQVAVVASVPSLQLPPNE